MKLSYLFESDERLRRLERLAAGGDEEAALRLELMRGRVGESDHDMKFLEYWVDFPKYWYRVSDRGDRVVSGYLMRLCSLLYSSDWCNFVGDLVKVAYNRHRKVVLAPGSGDRKADLMFQRWINRVRACDSLDDNLKRNLWDYLHLEIRPSLGSKYWRLYDFFNKVMPAKEARPPLPARNAAENVSIRGLRSGLMSQGPPGARGAFKWSLLRFDDFWGVVLKHHSYPPMGFGELLIELGVVKGSEPDDHRRTGLDELL